MSGEIVALCENGECCIYSQNRCTQAKKKGGYHARSTHLAGVRGCAYPYSEEFARLATMSHSGSRTINQSINQSITSHFTASFTAHLLDVKYKVTLDPWTPDLWGSWNQESRFCNSVNRKIVIPNRLKVIFKSRNGNGYFRN